MQKPESALKGVLRMHASLLEACKEAGGHPNAFHKIGDLDHLTVLNLLEALGPNHIVFKYQVPEAGSDPAPEPTADTDAPLRSLAETLPRVISGKVLEWRQNQVDAKQDIAYVDLVSDDGHTYKNLSLASNQRLPEHARVRLSYDSSTGRWGTIRYLE